MTENRLFYKKIAKELLLLLATILLCRFTEGLAAYPVVVWGCLSALRRNVARAFACMATLFLLVLTNPFFIPNKSPLFSYAVRGGAFIISIALSLGCEQSKFPRRLPLGMLFAYLSVCAFSSATGWLPQVSFLKLVMFSAFLLAIIVGARNLQASFEGLQLLRCFFMATSVYLIIGSLLLWPFPQWSSLGAVLETRKNFGDTGLVEDMLAGEMVLNQTLLCGVVYHSQALASVCCCAFAFVVADMLFVEKRIVWLHVCLIFSAIIVVYLTRSRTALFALSVAIILIMFFAGRNLWINAVIRNNLRTIVKQGLLIMLVVGAVFEIRGGTMSKWLRKKNDVAGDERNMVTALTESRQGLIEKSMRDFKLNPLFGMGFQVEERHRDQIKGYSGHGLILSASIEKGLLPLMVLGESGIVGSIVFIIFLFYFYGTCVHEKLIATRLMFTVLLAANMGEATFFSSGGPGGMQWLFTAVGGFMVDFLSSPYPHQPRLLSRKKR